MVGLNKNELDYDKSQSLMWSASALLEMIYLAPLQQGSLKVYLGIMIGFMSAGGLKNFKKCFG